MQTHEKNRNEQGFALILAILALVLLTFLGLTLAVTTSTELQIATNYRWSQQAYYNAEAGIEAAKIILRDVPTDWSTVLPQARGGWASVDGSGNPKPAPKCGTGSNCTPPATSTRNFEASDCDNRVGAGYGAVLAAGGQVYQDVTNFMGQPVDGAFTLWVRRDVLPDPANPDTQLIDDPSNTDLVLVSEGVAPTPQNAPGALQQAGRAVRLLQVKVTRAVITNPCQAAEGQTGGTASGANFGACAPLATGSVDQSLGGGNPVGEFAGVK